MHRARLLAITAALVVSMIAAPGNVSAQELSPTNITGPATDSPPQETWLTGVPASVAGHSHSLLLAPGLSDTIPPGWKEIVDESLGYSLAVPSNWLTFDLQAGGLDRISSLLGGRAASQQLHQYLATPAGENLGIIAVEPDPGELFARPPFPTFLNVSLTPLPAGLADDRWVAMVEESISALGEVRIEAVELATRNALPAIRAAAAYQLGGQGSGLTAYLDITIVRVDQMAYTLTIATRLSNALAKQPVFDHIVQSFRPVLPEQEAAAKPAQTPAKDETRPGSATSVPAASVPSFWIPIVDGRLGYSFALPGHWLTFDLHGADLDRMTDLIGSETATHQLKALLDSPAGEQLGIFAVDPHPGTLYTVPTVPTFLTVTTAPLPDEVSDEEWVALVEEAISAWGDTQLITVEMSTRNNLPVIRAAAAIRLGDQPNLLTAHLDITVLRANQTAYVLTIAAHPDNVSANQPVIEQIIDSFQVK